MYCRTKQTCFFLFLGIILILSSCKDNDVKPANKSLISSESLFIRSASELRTILSVAGIDIPVSAIQQDVEIYKVTYHTSYLNNQDITASGLVILPKTKGSYPMLSFQHGTIAAHSQAPSVLPTSSTELVLYSALASPGFITAVPDLIGFGSSANLMHPYYVEELTASAVIDLLQAAKELGSEKGIDFNEKLFLAGYSQGGYATMAAHKSIEENGLDGFQLIASFPAAGGYDVKAMQEYFFGLDTYDNPFYLGFVATAYKSTYQWTQSLGDFFKEPYATRIPTLYDGSKSGSEINAQLTTSIRDFVSADLLLHIDTDTKYKYIVDAFNQNSLTDWKPLKKMYMYHGDADITVPYNNSVITYNKLIANGASASVVSFTSLPGATHGTGVLPYVEKFIPIMLSLK